MGNVIAPAGAKEVRIRAQVTRADGRVEPGRTVCYWHKNPLRRCWFKLKQAVCGAAGVRI